MKMWVLLFYFQLKVILIVTYAEGASELKVFNLGENALNPSTSLVWVRFRLCWNCMECRGCSQLSSLPFSLQFVFRWSNAML